MKVFTQMQLIRKIKTLYDVYKLILEIPEGIAATMTDEEYFYMLDDDLVDKLIKSDVKYYFIDGNICDWETSLPTEEEINYMISRGIKIIVWFPEEAWHSGDFGSGFITDLHLYCTDMGYPADMIYFVTGNYLIHECYEKWKKIYGYTSDVFINFVTFEVFKYYVFDLFDIVNGEIGLQNANRGDVYHREKRFLCMNKGGKQHRVDVVNRLLESGYNDLGHISYVQDRHFKLDHKFDHLLPLRIDTTNEKLMDTHNNLGLAYLFNRSYFSIVTETYSSSIIYAEKNDLDWSQVGFVTEKTFKCFRHKHPFLAVAVQGHLWRMKQLGFKTFEGFIDESYDDHTDEDVRFNMIMNEVNRLCVMSDREIAEWYKSLEHILDYNQDHLLNNYDDLKQLFRELS